METWRKILIGIIAFLAVVFIGGFYIYNYYIIPTYIEPALQLASDALKDKEVQSLLAELADDLVDEGVLNQETAKNYIRQTNKQNRTSEPIEEENELESILTEEDIQEQFLNPESTTKPRDTESMIVAFSSNSNIGIETIKSDEDQSEKKTSSYHTYSDKQAYIAKNQGIDHNIAAKKDEAKEDGEFVDIETDKNTATTLYNRVINAMAPQERTVFYTVLTKVSVAELRTLYSAGDKEGIKTHLKERLDTQIYKSAVSIFYKYAPLLYQK